jgi:hypothetical protein
MVIVVNGGTVGVGNDLAGALQASLHGQTGGGGTGPPTGNVDQQVASLIDQALQHFSLANTALTAGNLGLYQSELKTAQDLMTQAKSLLAKAASGTGVTPSPSASVSASPSP